MARILIVDDQDVMRDSLAATLARQGHEVVAATDGPGAISRLSGPRFELMISDLKMPKMSGTELLAEARKIRPEMPVVLMTAFATVSTAVEAMKMGAYDYIQKPFDGEEIKHLVERTLEHNRLRLENQALRTMAELNAPRPLVGTSGVMNDVRATIERVAKSNATMLVCGESGTGKEVVARAIHLASDRKERPMLAVRKRLEDVPELCRHFLHQIAKREKSVFRHLESEAIRLLQRYEWPGNVRELQNISERACVLEIEPGVIRAATIEPWLRSSHTPAAVAGSLAGTPLSEIEKQVILSTLEKFKGHRIKTAHALQIGVRTLGMKLKKWREEGELVEARM